MDRLMFSLPRLLRRSKAWVWSAPSCAILSNFFLMDRTSSSQDILVCKPIRSEMSTCRID